MAEENRLESRQEGITLKGVLDRTDEKRVDTWPGTEIYSSRVASIPVDTLERDLQKYTSRGKGVMVTKIGLIFIFLIGHFLYTRKFNSPRRSVECIKDYVFELTQELNDKVNRDPTFLKMLQISSSTLVDFADLSVMITFYLKGNNLRYPLQLIFFYTIRGMVQGNFLFRFPEGTIWTFPGIPSLTVPYGLMSDFYFSGHCGFVTIMAFENLRLGNRWISTFLFVSLAYLGFVLVVTRVHYSIDIPVGIMAGAYAHYWANKYIRRLECALRYLFNRHIWLRIPYFAEI